MHVSFLHGFAGAVALSVLLLTASGCRRPSGLEVLLGDRAGTPAPSSTGSCDLELEGAAGETVFFVLGMLDEYQGRMIVEDEDLVERFYCNEPAASAVFHEAVQRLAQEQQLDPGIETERAQDCLMFYRSKPIADRLNSCYQYEASTSTLVQGSDGTYRRTANPSLGSLLFLRSGQNNSTGGALSDQVFYRRRALAYLSGAWTRYGRGSDLVFANAQDKVRLVAQLLRYLGCRNVRIESNVGVIPQTNLVKFEPTDEVRALLDGKPVSPRRD